MTNTRNNIRFEEYICISFFLWIFRRKVCHIIGISAVLHGKRWTTERKEWSSDWIETAVNMRYKQQQQYLSPTSTSQHVTNYILLTSSFSPTSHFSIKPRAFDWLDGICSSPIGCFHLSNCITIVHLKLKIALFIKFSEQNSLKTKKKKRTTNNNFR